MAHATSGQVADAPHGTVAGIPASVISVALLVLALTSQRTATSTVNPVPSGPLPAPSLVNPAADARFSPAANITFDLSDVTAAANYTIQIDDNNSFPSPFIVNQTVATSQFSTSTLPTLQMWWRVRANDASGNPGTWSGARRVEVKNCLKGAVADRLQPRRCARTLPPHSRPASPLNPDLPDRGRIPEQPCQRLPRV